MQDLYIELTTLRNNLDKSIKILKERGQAKSEAEKDYRVALAKEILILRDKGIPVTIINDLVRGTEKIAELKQKRDIAETLYESNMQYIYSVKMNIGIVERQIEATRRGE